MDGAALFQLISQRQQLLEQLLELGSRQIEVIAAGRMSELMQLLSRKQRPLEELGEISRRLREAADEDPASRHWPGPEIRQQCRDAQQRCEQLHVELLAMEAQCETALEQTRQQIQQQLTQIDAAHQAANRYAGNQSAPTTGSRLDLSSD